MTTPPVIVRVYLFPNYDRMHRVILSCREREEERWTKDLDGMLKSFRITSVRGPGHAAHEVGSGDY